jgi:hypothetical protein
LRYKLARPWTPEDIEEFRRLAAANFSALRIAAKLKRTVRSIQLRARVYGITIKNGRRSIGAASV